MSLTVAIDAGLRNCGLAVYDDGILVHGCLVRNPETTVRGPRAWAAMAEAVLCSYPLAADTLIVETMQYDGRTSRGVAPDVFEVSGVTSHLLAAFQGRVVRAVPVTEAEWKRGVPKHICHARMYQELSAEEAAAIEAAGSLKHNIEDAAAIGLWWVKKSGERAKLSEEAA